MSAHLPLLPPFRDRGEGPLAIQKRKILESAQKHLQKGALDRALKDYTTLLEADPKDVNVRLKIGDIQLKLGHTKEAVAAYLRVANRFMQDGFEAKAVALYKQITRIDPKRIDAFVPLAELYQRLGLTSDAMAAFQTAADAYYREGQRAEALELLRKMAGLDPTNTTNRLKVADLLRHEGRTKEALVEFDEVAAELERQGDIEGRVRVLERIVDADPSRFDALDAIARAHLAAGRADEAERAARAMLDQQPDELAGHELLAEALELAGRQEEAAESWRRTASLYKERGDESRARDIMQRFVSTLSLGPEDSGPPVLEAAGAVELGAPGAPAGLAPEEAVLPGEETGQEIWLEESVANGGPAHASPAAGFAEAFEAPEPEASFRARPEGPPEDGGDPEQMLAEASVYLRYGKQDRAIERLRQVLGQQPDHRGALEKLGEALLAAGEADQAIHAFERAVERAREEGDADAARSLAERLAGLDPAAAARLGLDAEPLESEEGAHGPDVEFDLEEFDLAGEGGQSAELGPEFDLETAAAVPHAREAEHAGETDPAGFELDLDLDLEDAEPVAPEGDPHASPEILVEPDEALLEAPGAHAHEEPRAPSAKARVQGEATGPIPVTGSLDATPERIVESLEEAAFYLEQGMRDEARAVYEHILAVVPNHPLAQLRLGELEARVPDEEVTETRAASEQEAEDGPSPAWDAAAALDDDGIDWDDDADVLPDDGAYEAPSFEPVRGGVTGAESAQPGDAFDLAAELTGALEGGETRPLGGAGGTEDEAFEQVFAAFKEGVQRELGDGDHRAHYDLGIAYKEMGLLEEALSELATAMAAEEHRLGCLHMMGLCALELGRSVDAVAHLEQALALPVLVTEQEVPLRFDLGRAYAAAGDVLRARAAFEAVRAADPSFADVEGALADLPAQAHVTEPQADDEPEGLEDFDPVPETDLDVELREGAAEAEAPAYESFEDLLSEGAEDEEQPVEALAPEATGEDRGEPDTGPAVPSETPASGRRPRRRKISFV